MELTVSCPDGAASGDSIEIETPEGARLAVTVPDGIRPGDAFQVQPPRPTPELGEVFASVLEALDDAEAVEDFMELHCGSFAAYRRGGEQRLEWTTLHSEYVTTLEGVIGEQLNELHSSADDVFRHAQGSLQRGSQADKLLSRLLSMQDYEVFCGMMHAECTGVIDPWLVRRMMADGVGPTV